jgi:hypothetical protein
MHLVWHYIQHRRVPAKPYAIGHMDHTHFVAPPNLHLIAGLPEAMRAAGF